MSIRANNPRFQAVVLYDWGDALLGQADWVQAEQKFQKAHDLRQENVRIIEA